MDQDPIVTMDDIRKAGYCARGARRWFETHGLDFRDFMENGVPASVMLATGDAQGEHVVRCKQERDRHG